MSPPGAKAITTGLVSPCASWVWVNPAGRLGLIVVVVLPDALNCGAGLGPGYGGGVGQRRSGRGRHLRGDRHRPHLACRKGCGRAGHLARGRVVAAAAGALREEGRGLAVGRNQIGDRVGHGEAAGVGTAGIRGSDGVGHRLPGRDGVRAGRHRDRHGAGGARRVALPTAKPVIMTVRPSIEASPRFRETARR